MEEAACESGCAVRVAVTTTGSNSRYAADSAQRLPDSAESRAAASGSCSCCVIAGDSDLCLDIKYAAGTC